MSVNESRVHFRVGRFIQESAMKLRMKPVTTATAAVLYFKFFKHMSLTDFDPYLIATTAIYLAGKVEEDYNKIRDVINVAYRTLYKNRTPLEIDDTFWALKESVCNCELYMLRILQFKVKFDHPHKFLVHYLKSLHDWYTPAEWQAIPLAATAWSLLRDVYHGTTCIQYKSQHLAIAAISLALQTLGSVVPSNDIAGTQWWQVFDDEMNPPLLEQIMVDMLDLYNLEANT